MSEPAPGGGTDPAFLRARKRRNIFIALSLIAFVVLVFFITIAKMKPHP